MTLKKPPRFARHPNQPLIADEDGAPRFKQNAIVRYLLDNGGHDLEDLRKIPFSTEDRVQFAQLIGYSLCGWSELPYVSGEAYVAVEKTLEKETRRAS